MKFITHVSRGQSVKNTPRLRSVGLIFLGLLPFCFGSGKRRSVGTRLEAGEWSPEVGNFIKVWKGGNLLLCVIREIKDTDTISTMTHCEELAKQPRNIDLKGTTDLLVQKNAEYKRLGKCWLYAFSIAVGQFVDITRSYSKIAEPMVAINKYCLDYRSAPTLAVGMPTLVEMYHEMVQRKELSGFENSGDYRGAFRKFNLILRSDLLSLNGIRFQISQGKGNKDRLSDDEEADLLFQKTQQCPLTGENVYFGRWCDEEDTVALIASYNTTIEEDEYMKWWNEQDNAGKKQPALRVRDKADGDKPIGSKYYKGSHCVAYVKIQEGDFSGWWRFDNKETDPVHVTKPELSYVRVNPRNPEQITSKNAWHVYKQGCVWVKTGEEDSDSPESMSWDLRALTLL